jgi:hypothetical protein
MAYITIKTNTDEGVITLQERVVPSGNLYSVAGAAGDHVAVTRLCPTDQLFVAPP